MRLAAAYAALCLVQAGAILLPGRMLALPPRLQGRAWALVLPGVLVAFVVGLSADPSLATRLAALAALTPVLALGAPFVAARRWCAVVAVVALAAVAIGLWQQHDIVGGVARTVAIACACSLLASLLAGVAPPTALRAGLVVLVAIDVVLVISGSVGRTSTALHQASAPAGLPDFQDATIGPATMGYGDLFGAAVLGAVLTSERRPRARPAAIVLVAALAFGLLLTRFDELPATVPLLAGLVVSRQESRSM